MNVAVVLNGEEVHVPDGSSVADVIAVLDPGLVGPDGSAGRGTAVAVGEEVVPAGRWASTPVRAGDRLEVLHAVAGG